MREQCKFQNDHNFLQNELTDKNLRGTLDNILP